MPDGQKTLWELLWDYDPNGLIAIDRDTLIRVVNPAFCRMFKVRPRDVIGQPAKAVLSDAAELMELWGDEQTQTAREKHYSELQLHVRQVIFTIAREGILGCIMVDLTHEWQQKNEIARLKRDTVQRVQEVVNNQMKVAHEIASLLGETTAESKVSLTKLVEMIDHEAGDALS